MIVPSVSVLLPVHNAADYIAEAVGSILAQTLRNFELLIHDDGSTDDSLPRLTRLAASDSRIRLTTGANRGLVATLNDLLAAARAPLIARMDADDVALPDRLALQSAEMTRRPRLAALGGAVLLTDRAGHVVHQPAPVLGNHAVQREALAGRTPICHPASMLRTTLVRDLGGYRADTWPAEDLDLFLRLGEVGELDNLSQAVLRYRLHPSSISASRAADQIDKMRRVCHDAAHRRGLAPTFVESEPTTPDTAAALALPGVMSNPTARALVRAGAAADTSPRRACA